MAGATGLQGYVPFYDTHGHQHHAKPFKDKSHLLTESISHPKWLDPAPVNNSQAELQRIRNRGTLPSSQTWQQQENSIPGKVYPTDVRNLSYPSHFNAQNVPAHATRTALQVDRRAQAKGVGAAIGERYAAMSSPVIEPQPPNAQTEPRVCTISHISERVDADHQASRARGGLLSQFQPVNPERELRTVGLGYVEEPTFATRGQLLETRKEAMKHECEELRARGDELNVPNSVRRTEKEAQEFEFRRADKEPMTLTRMKDKWRQDKIEYDMRNFSCPKRREYPRFSDRPDIPFWMNDPSNELNAMVAPQAVPRTLSEPAFKVTEVPFGDDIRKLQSNLTDSASAVPVEGRATVEPETRFGSNTVKRWSADMLDRGQGRNKPRLFDSIQHVQVGPRDLESLDHTSSMEPIRSAALRHRAEERRANAVNPRRSRLWVDASQHPSASQAPHGTSLDLPDGMSIQRSIDRTIAGSNRIRSDPTLRGAISLDKTENFREPKFFGSTARSCDQTGVRCGGFQRLDWPPRQSRNQQRAKNNRNGGDPSSKERSRLEPKDSMALANPAAGAMAQPL